jgi:hypothetical protein
MDRLAPVPDGGTGHLSPIVAEAFNKLAQQVVGWWRHNRFAVHPKGVDAAAIVGRIHDFRLGSEIGRENCNLSAWCLDLGGPRRSGSINTASCEAHPSALDSYSGLGDTWRPEIESVIVSMSEHIESESP